MLKLELTEKEVFRLTTLYETSPKNRVRQRAQGLLLLGRGYHRKEVSKLLNKKADTISTLYWRYCENRNWDLIDDPGRGRKPSLNTALKKNS